MTMSKIIGQITTTKIAPKSDLADNTPYDSTINFIGKNVYKYLGQELYLNGMAESLRKHGYRSFSLDYTKDTKVLSNTYKPIMPENKESAKFDLGGGKTQYDAIVGKYFKVLDVLKHPKSETSANTYAKFFYLKLQDKTNNDIVYYEYDSEFDFLFPFIVTGFFEKQKKLVVGQEFVFSDRMLEGLTDISTGKTITMKTGQKWKCVDFTIEEKYYTLALIIQNSLGEKTDISYESVFDKSRKGNVYSIKEVDAFRKKFGIDTFNKILQGNAVIGMTKEMCRLAWGEPKSINETITSGKKTEQWVYSENYLYFDNGILTAIQ